MAPYVYYTIAATSLHVAIKLVWMVDLLAITIALDLDLDQVRVDLSGRSLVDL